ncbi:MAG: DsbA family oxidoreductase [Phototrophicaceae bacterium]|jgi:predicted DsbA family dithiol-disulfide isomerase
MRVDIFHDTVCPWCRIGKANLLKAAKDFGEPLEIHYHTFFLNDSIPPEGTDFRELLLAKGGGRVRDLEMFFAAPREAGARVGLTFNFEQITRAPNTTLSHQLIALTPEAGKPAMIDAIYAAYFEHGQDIGQLPVLLDIAAAQGLDRADIERRLLGEEGREQVLQEAAEGIQLGVTGVPLFVFGNTFALSGAQPPAVMLKALQQAQQFSTVS